MLIVHLVLTLNLPYVVSLKGRRKVVNSIKDRLRRKNIAVVDISGEYAKEAQLELLFFAGSPNEANDKVEKIYNTLSASFPTIDIELEYEIL
ncbi:MAG: DUF503 domain-containing protein [Epsilonproteobacteria bacterium]|nr:DUF503 domain-containing protein [Campylobacterota bacterium]